MSLVTPWNRHLYSTGHFLQPPGGNARIITCVRYNNNHRPHLHYHHHNYQKYNHKIYVSGNTLRAVTAGIVTLRVTDYFP